MYITCVSSVYKDKVGPVTGYTYLGFYEHDLPFPYKVRCQGSGFWLFAEHEARQATENEIIFGKLLGTC